MLTVGYIFINILQIILSDDIVDIEERIVGGHEVDPPHKYPFQVKDFNTSKISIDFQFLKK